MTPTATCWGNGWPSSLLNIGAPDDSYFTLGCGQSVIVDLGVAGTPIINHAGYDFVYYERYTPDPPAGIYLDSVILEVCTTANCTTPYVVFNWGDGPLDANSNVGVWAAAQLPPVAETDNAHIPESALYGTSPLRTGIAIDVGAAPGNNYKYLRITAPLLATDGAEIDAIQVLP
jgi:hypothetical protein